MNEDVGFQRKFEEAVIQCPRCVETNEHSQTAKESQNAVSPSSFEFQLTSDCAFRPYRTNTPAADAAGPVVSHAFYPQPHIRKIQCQKTNAGRTGRAQPEAMLMIAFSTACFRARTRPGRYSVWHSTNSSWRTLIWTPLRLNRATGWMLTSCAGSGRIWWCRCA